MHEFLRIYILIRKKNPNKLFKKQFLMESSYILFEISVVDYSYRNVHWKISQHT